MPRAKYRTHKTYKMRVSKPVKAKRNNGIANRCGPEWARASWQGRKELVIALRQKMGRNDPAIDSAIRNMLESKENHYSLAQTYLSLLAKEKEMKKDYGITIINWQL